jgi:hypothetical protein
MGADLLINNLWQSTDVELDWIAGRTFAANLPVGLAPQLLERQPHLDEDLEPGTESYAEGLAKRAREHLTARVDELHTALTATGRDAPRDLTWIGSPDGRWRIYLTGGMSWGDSPSDLYDAIDDLWHVPQVLAALGFAVDEDDLRERCTGASHPVTSEHEGRRFCVDCGQSVKAGDR